VLRGIHATGAASAGEAKAIDYTVESGEAGEVVESIYERRKVCMRLDGTSVSVMPREFTSAENGNGDVLDARDIADTEAICRDGVWVYTVQQGRCIQLRIQNNGQEFFVGWNREQVDVYGRRYRNGSGVRLSAGGVYDMTMFRLQGNAIDVAFSNDDNEVLLRMRFENVANVSAASPVGGSGGAHVPQTGGSGGARVPAQARMQALVHMRALLHELRGLGVQNGTGVGGQAQGYVVLYEFEFRHAQLGVIVVQVRKYLGADENNRYQVWWNDDQIEILSKRDMQARYRHVVLIQKE
jgi:hypothetical protein